MYVNIYIHICRIIIFNSHHKDSCDMYIHWLIYSTNYPLSNYYNPETVLNFGNTMIIKEDSLFLHKTNQLTSGVDKQ